MGKKGEPDPQEYIVGYEYYAGIHMIACHGPVTAVKQINAADYVAWVGNVTESQQIRIDAPNLFVGPAEVENFDEDLWKDPDEYRENLFTTSQDSQDFSRSDGGIVGDVDIEFGNQDQGRNSYLLEKLGGQALSAFRGVLGFVLRQVYIGNSAYVKPWNFLISNFELTDDWYPEKKMILSQEKTVTQSYVQLGYAAVLKVTISPQEAIDAGAMWRVCETTTERYTETWNNRTATRIVKGDPITDWLNSGDIYESNERKTVFVEYKTIDTLYAPLDKEITLVEGQYLVEAIYTETDPSSDEEEDTNPTHER